MTIRLVVVLFVILFGATACTEEHFISGEEPETPEQPEVPVAGDTIASFSDFKLNEEAWSYSNGLAAADHYFDGYVEYKVDDKVVKSDLIDHENAPMRISWEPIAETTATSAEKMYLGYSVSEAKNTESHTNQKVNFKKYERECKLSFVGMEVTLTGSWYEASLGTSNVVACRYDSTTVATQKADTLKVNGEKIEIDLDGKKYNRVVVTAKAENHFTDLPAGTTHSEQMDIEYSVLVPVVFVPGEKFYEGSIAGNGSYTKASEESYCSSLELKHIFTQDGKQLTEQETVSGIATVKTWVEEAGPKMIVPTIQIGNPTVSVSENSSNLYKKEGYIYAKMYKTTWTYTWSNGFSKRVYSEVERLYYMREEGKAVAMPYGETSTSFSNFNAGNSVEKSENDKKYDAYPNGVVSFTGAHKSSTGNVNDAIAGLEVAQEFWVAKEEVKDEFIDFDKEIIAGSKDKDAQIIIIEHWSISGDKEIVYTQSANYTFSVSEQQRVFGEALAFVSGPAKSTNATEFNEVKENQFVRTVTTITSVNFNPTCEVKAIAKATEAYIEYRGEKIYFKFAEATVEYKGINNPTATEVEAEKKYTRRSYEVSFAHSVLGTKKASVLVDEEIIDEPSQDDPTQDDPTQDDPTQDDPTQDEPSQDEPSVDEPTVDEPVVETPEITIPSEWGNIDIAKTKAYGTISVAWELQSNGTFMPIYSGTVITSKGIVSFRNGYEQFTAMNTASISDKVGNAWDGSRLYPSYIEVDRSGNISWSYISVVNGSLLTDVNSSKMTVVGGIDLNNPFVANGGNASVYTFSENGNTVRVVVTFNGVIFNEVFAK